VAMGLEGMHAEFGGQVQGLLVIAFGLLKLWWMSMSGDIAEEAKSIRLVASFLVLTGKR